MVTKTQETAEANLSAELKKLQEDFYRDWVAGSLPKVWNEIPLLHPTLPNKVKVTLTLDEDMVIWFRKLGRGYQARVNSILRVYWHALLSGHVKAHWDAQTVAPREHSMLEDMLRTKIKQIRNGEVTGVSKKALGAMERELTESLETVKMMHRKERSRR